jgi:hypothetical protein
MRLYIAGLVVASCAYQPGSFRSECHTFAGQRWVTGCLDIAVERRPDLPRGDIVLAYTFGNRCDTATVVDLATVRVVGRGADGSLRPLAAYDPNREIESRWLDGRAVGAEVIAYTNSAGLADVCVGADSIGQTAITGWLCLAPQPQLREVP